MKLTSATKPRPMVGILSHQEVIDQIRHLYPRLGPALNTAIDRYRELVDHYAANPQPDVKDVEIPSCPHCGTKLKFTE